jgi:hypothetical protein
MHSDANTTYAHTNGHSYSYSYSDSDRDRNTCSYSDAYTEADA